MFRYILPTRVQREGQMRRRFHSGAIRRAASAAIEGLESRRLLATITVTGTGDTIAVDGLVTLREAITSANNNSNINTDVVATGGAYGSDAINFNIAGAGIKTISPTTELPDVTGTTTINGYSQPGASVNTLAVGDNAVILIELRGTNVPDGGNGLYFSASNSVVRGLAIGGFRTLPNASDPNSAGGHGIVTAMGFTNITVAGNFLGTDATGLVRVGNATGVFYTSSSGTIGGTAPADRNLLSGGDIAAGVLVGGDHNTIQGNYVGTNKNGTALLANLSSGIILTGTAAFSNLVGGNTAAARNLVAGGGACISSFAGAHDNTIQGNWVGLNATGTAGLGISSEGIEILRSSNNIVGGSGAGEGNVIGGANFGIAVLRLLDDIVGPDSTGNLIRGNYIGVTPGNVSVPNVTGISFQGTTGNTVGGTGAGEGNVISGNTFNGVDVRGIATLNGSNLTSGTGNRIIGNSMYDNGGLGIDLLDGPNQDQFGVTPDDPGDTDTGSNNLQNKPNVTTAHFDAGHLTISGNFQGSGAGTLFFDLYLSDTPDPSGFGEGKTYLGRFNVANGAGVVNFGTIDIAGAFEEGQWISGTFTDSNGNTSEFSNAKDVVVDGLDPFCVRNTNDSGAGSLRQAILNANAHANVGGVPDLICFEIAGTSLHTIKLFTQLPDLTDPFEMDGYVHQDGASANTLASGNNAKIFVVISGELLPDSLDGLRIDTDDSVIRGLVINKFLFGNAIHILPGHSGIHIEGDFLGTDATGTLPSFDPATFLAQSNGVLIDGAPNNTVGGTTPQQRNLISSNYAGITISGAGATGNLVEGNYIGTNAAGTASLTALGSGIVINSSGNTVGGTTAAARNLISGNSTNGVRIEGTDANSNFVTGNFIGTDPAGTARVSNGVGVYVNGGNNTIGGTVAGSRNIISGNSSAVGISAGTGSNIVQGNYIGLDVTGTTRVYNGDGVSVSNSPNNLIGGTTAAARNVIAGSIGNDLLTSGVALGNKIQGNYIGLNAAGNAALLPGSVQIGASAGGIFLNNSAAVLIGGTDPGAGNVISGITTSPGISTFSGTGHIIQGNFIGTDFTGTIGVPNGSGILINSSTNVQIGGSTPAARNIISGNKGSAIFLAFTGATGNKVQGNYIGTDITGTLAIPNGTDYGPGALYGKGAIAIYQTTNNTIGGTNPGEGNVIAFNVGPGVVLGKYPGDGANVTLGNAILGNSIFSNTTLGIDLNEDGPTSTRDAGDPDTGVNGLLNIPVVASAVADAFATKIHVQLANKASTTYRVEFFSNLAVDNSNFGEGKVYLGFADIPTNGSGTADTTITLPVSVAVGRFITATVTSAEGTSEFSAAAQASAGTTPPVLSINDLSINEGDSSTSDFTFTITRSGSDLSGTTTVHWATAAGTAVDGTDYTGNSGDVTFLANDTNKQVTIKVNGDTTFEADDTFFVNLSNASGATISDNQGKGTIKNDDPAPPLPAFSIDSLSKNEGNSSTTSFIFTVTRSGDTSGSCTVHFATANGSATLADSDYQANSNTLSFGANDTSKTITVLVNGDTKFETDESFVVNLTSPTGATIDQAQGTGTIQNDDAAPPPPLPALSINDVSLNEGDGGTTDFTFTITRSGSDLSGTSTVHWATAAGTAVDGTDYTGNSGDVTFLANDTTVQITVKVNGDTTFEADDTFFVNLSNVSGATIADSQGKGTIKNDDPAPPPPPLPPVLSIDDVSLNEGNSSTTDFTFTITRTGDLSGASTVHWATAAGTAGDGSDYTGASGDATFLANDKTVLITVKVKGDTTFEPEETFFVNLTNVSGATIGDYQGKGSIKNDDASPPPPPPPGATLAINDVSKDEGDCGKTAFTFTVTRSGDTSRTSTVKYKTADGSAKAGCDYQCTSGTLTFKPGEKSHTITINVFGDKCVEGNETFKILLSSPTNATIADGTGHGTIKNDDDAPPRICIGDQRVKEGDSGLIAMTFTVTLDKASDKPVSVDFKTCDGSAKAGCDYNSVHGTITFKAGEKSKTITVYIRGEKLKESDETFYVNLFNAKHGDIGNSKAKGTILNDD